MVDESRRNFFRRTGESLGRVVVDEVDRKIEEKSSHWIRPPYAINELEFLLTCTRCNACIEACSYKVIFPLPQSTGVAAGTPALDLLNNACRLCSDVPCVNACDSGSLTMLIPQPEVNPDSDSGADADTNSSVKVNASASTSTSTNTDTDVDVEKGNDTQPEEFPRLAWLSLDTRQCLPYQGPECGACVSYCPVDGAMTLDMERPLINQELCRGCGLCRLNCILEPKAITVSVREPDSEH